MGKVACAFITQSGKIYIGQNLSTSADLGYCAEISAIAQMIAGEETQIKALVGVTEDGQLIPPCGRCRELMYQLNRNNLKTKIIFNENQIHELSELLPHRWQEYWNGRE